MAPIVPANTEHPSGESDDDLEGPGSRGIVPNVITLDDESSDSDNEVNHSHEGYELLSQDSGMDYAAFMTSMNAGGISFSPEDHSVSLNNENIHSSTISESASFVSGDNDDQSNETNQLNDVPQNNEDPVCTRCENEFPSADESPKSEATMDLEHIEKIKDVMKTITLPISNLPSWSQVVSEDDWKSVLLDKLNIKPNSCDQHKSSTSSSKSSPSSDAPSTSKNHDNED